MAEDFDQCWTFVGARLKELQADEAFDQLHIRVDCLENIELSTWFALKKKLAQTKRNYFRHGLSLDKCFKHVFLETELNANAMLLGTNENGSAQLNLNNFKRYAQRKYGSGFVLDDSDENPIWLFTTRAVFLGPGMTQATALQSEGLGAGVREQPPLSVNSVSRLIETGAGFLAKQVKPDGQFVYGLFPCFDKEIGSYNCLRHASSTYAMIEAWEVSKCPALGQSIERALDYLTKHLIKVVSLPNLPPGNELAFLVDTGNEIKLGGNAVCVLALCKYTEVTGDKRYLKLMNQLAHGIAAMFNTQTKQFVHVLNFPDLSIKEVFRIIYYDGEATFALMRLYRLTRNVAYLRLVEHAFEYFIRVGHDRSHDHWLSYCVNELTIYKPLRKYFEFGVRNFYDYLDFVLNRITTFPTLLELMMAAEQMLQRIKDDPSLHDLLSSLDLNKFYKALHFRANHLLTGYFWPELAMFFQNPQRITGSFFIRHHSFRIRIDDVEHYLSGLIAYRKFLLERKPVEDAIGSVELNGPILAWGGDVNLGRRMHRRVHELGEIPVLDIPALKQADFAMINLECVVALSGEQGVDKGEGGPFYFRARPHMLDILKKANIHGVLTANNHSGDYGPEALSEQAHWLENAGLKFAGSGMNSFEAGLPLYALVGDVRVAVFGIDTTQASFGASQTRPGSNFIDLSKFDQHEPGLRSSFDKAREWADLVFVAIHWGPNLQTKPTARVRQIARRLIALGANAILGSSAHVLQGIEVWNSCPIIYDAGDLLFDSRDDRKGKPGAVFGLRLSRVGVTAVEVHPLRVGYGHTVQIEADTAISQLSSFAELCRDLGTQVSIQDNSVGVLQIVPSQLEPAKHSSQVDVVKTATVIRLPADPPDLESIRKRWLLTKVPVDVEIKPLVLGPLVLKGLRFGPRRIVTRTMIWVESFWEVLEPINQDFLLDIQVVPVNGSLANSFGAGCDHQPCDWLEPTSQWTPGQLYRDWYGLRPPKQANMKPGSYRLSIRILGDSKVISGVSFLDSIEVDCPEYDRQYNVVSLDPRPTDGVWMAQELAQVTGGEWIVPPKDRAWVANGVVRAQSHVRFVGSPCLFVASDRENLRFHEMSSTAGGQASLAWDRHDQLHNIQTKFCGAIVKKVPIGLRPDFPLLKVADPIRALMELGAAARQRMQGLVVAVTGSAGKSSVVGMANHVASAFIKTASSYDNYNSRVGMLICLSSMAADTQLAVLEVAISAINAPGYVPIKAVAPDVAVITNIAASHLKSGQTLSDIARRKSNIMEGVRQGGVVVLNRDDQFFDCFAKRANTAGLRVVCVGQDEQSDVRLIRYNAQNFSFVAMVFGRTLNVRLSVPGEHMALNACFVLAILSIQGVLQSLSEDELNSRLDDFNVPEGRGNHLSIALGARKVTVVDESYNANPSSMKAALSTFTQSPVPHESKILVLGDMLELGDLSEQSHSELLEPLGKTPVRELLLIGLAMRSVHDGLAAKGVRSLWFEDLAGLKEFLLKHLKGGDFVMCKASNGVGLFKLIEALKSQQSERMSDV